MAAPRQRRQGRRKLVPLLIIVVIVAVIVAIASNSKTPTTTSAGTVPVVTDSTDSTAAPAPTTAPTVPPTTVPGPGAVLDVRSVSGTEVHVAVVQVIDPATPADTFNAADAGKRLVGVRLQIENAGTNVLTDDANDDLTVVGSDQQTYTPSFSNMAGCTNFNDGQYTLPPGSTTVGCVVYELPDAVKVADVNFQLVGGGSGQLGQWKVG